MKKTAVKFLVNSIKKISRASFLGLPMKDSIDIYNKAIEQAYKIQKENILEAYRNGRTDQQSGIDKWHNRTALQYYNDTYNS
jgi:hypothetical protein